MSNFKYAIFWQFWQGKHIMQARDIDVTGEASETGQHYFVFNKAQSDPPKDSLTKEQLWSGTGSKAFDKLAADGIVVIGSVEQKLLREKVAGIDMFQPARIVEQVGHEGRGPSFRFTLPSGTIIQENDAHVRIAITPIERKCSKRGSRRGWKRRVATPLVGQHYCVFGLMFMFAAPLIPFVPLHDNFGFESVGLKDTGKSTLLRLMASTTGGIDDGDDGRYFEFFDSTVNALEDTMAAHRHLPLLLDEANLYAIGEKKAGGLASKLQDAAFKLGGGTGKARYGAGAAERIRLLYWITANDTLASLTGAGASAAAARDRTMTLPIQGEHGVFTFLPDGVQAKRFADALIAGAARHHGVAMPRFLERLVTRRNADEAALRTKIAGLIDRFRQTATGRTGQAESRVMNNFGLVYAAGELAKEYRVLPRAFDCLEAALHAFIIHRSVEESTKPFEERLIALASGPTVRKVGARADRMSDEEFKRGLFLRENSNGFELIISPRLIESVFPDWRSIRTTDQVGRLLRTSGKSKRMPRAISTEHDPEDYFVFRMPADRL